MNIHLRKYFQSILLPIILGQLLSSCSKDPTLIPDNQPPDLDNVPTVLIENYVNRIFIDLIGREPFEAEMDSNVAFFKANSLNTQSRETLIKQLQTNTDWIEGDTSYKHAYYQRFYDQSKVRMIEGDGDAYLRRRIGLLNITVFRDSLNGDTIPLGNAISTARVQLEIDKLKNVLKIKKEYREGIIEIDEIFRRLANNFSYDQINMNNFNFINATFDNMFFRFPTDTEFWLAWDMVDKNLSANLLGRNGQTRGDYLEILTESKEFYQGLIMWAYLNLLARFPTSAEISTLLNQFSQDKNFQAVQITIMTSNEYANF